MGGMVIAMDLVIQDSISASTVDAPRSVLDLFRLSSPWTKEKRLMRASQD
jgi:hypothetical protein